MNQIAIDKSDDDFSYLRLSGKRFPEPHLYIYTIAKTTSYGKDDCHNGNDSQQQRIGESSSLRQYALRRKELDGKKQYFDNLIEDAPHR